MTLNSRESDCRSLFSLSQAIFNILTSKVSPRDERVNSIPGESNVGKLISCEASRVKVLINSMNEIN